MQLKRKERKEKMKNILLGVLILVGLLVNLNAGESEENKQACNRGSAISCARLGYMYEKGNKVDQDDRRAAMLYGKACSGGYSGGCIYLGVMHEHGQGVELSDSKAKELYKKACDMGDSMGCQYYTELNR